jgi:RNA polymerase sigma-70 factor (ECF subfamily)
VKINIAYKPGGETDLVSRIRAGDQQAESEMVESYDRIVKSIIRRGVANASEASDLYQETFYIVIESIRRGAIREAERLSGFVCGVAKNRVIKYFQRAARQESSIETEEAVLLQRSESNQFEDLLKKEKAKLVRQVLKEMTNERDIQLLSRFYLAEEDKEHICADLGLTSLQFNLVLHRARQRYKELYEQALRSKQ